MDRLEGGVGLDDRLMSGGLGEMGEWVGEKDGALSDLSVLLAVPPPLPRTTLAGGDGRRPACVGMVMADVPPAIFCAARDEVGLSTARVMIEARLGPGACGADPDDGALTVCPGEDAPGRGGNAGDEVVVGEFLATA